MKTNHNLFDKSDRRLFLFFALFIAAGLFIAWMLTDNRRSDPLEVQNLNYHRIKGAIGGREEPVALRRYNARFVCPVKPDWNRCLTSEYGTRYSPKTGALQYHVGADITGGPRAEILSTDAGIVWKTGYNKWDGKFIVILHGDGYRSQYNHLSSIFVRPGESVSTGQVIGRMGSTGYVTGEHLHFEVWLYGSPQDVAQLLRITTNEDGYF